VGVKQSEREVDNSPISSAEFKNAWSYTSTLQYVFIAWYLVKHRVFYKSEAQNGHVSKKKKKTRHVVVLIRLHKQKLLNRTHGPCFTCSWVGL